MSYVHGPWTPTRNIRRSRSRMVVYEEVRGSVVFKIATHNKNVALYLFFFFFFIPFILVALLFLSPSYTVVIQIRGVT